MTASGASAASSYALSQQIQSLTQPHKKSRHPSISDVDTQGANAASSLASPSPTAKSAHKVDIKV